MRSSTIVLLVTGIAAILMLIFFLVAFVISENKNPPAPTTLPLPAPIPSTVCAGEGFKQVVPSLPYQRMIPFSNGIAYSKDDVSFIGIEHTVRKLTRLRSLEYPVSPNHWLGSAMFGASNSFMCYPWLAAINDNSFIFSWPGVGHVTEKCNSPPCQVGQEELFLLSSFATPIVVSCVGQTTVANDIVNVDGLTSTIVWQYKNSFSSLVTAFSVILTQGSPFITIKNAQNSITLDVSMENLVRTSYGYLFTVAGENFVLFLPSNVNLVVSGPTHYQLPTFLGYMRFAHYHDVSELNALIAAASVIPLESQVNLAIQDGSEWQVDLSYNFSFGGTGTNVMMQLPHQKVQNPSLVAGPYPHPLLGPYRMITTPNNQWNIVETVEKFDFAYPVISNPALLTVWKADVESVLDYNTPDKPVDWMLWLGSIANLILLGTSLQQSTTDLLSLLTNQLSRITIYNGLLTNNVAFLYDDLWSGVLTNMGITKCEGTEDQGDAFYHSHISNHGYLVYAYAVAFNFSSVDFINKYSETALYFARSLLNPSSDDSSFPLWRHKHWYLGYSLETGIEPSTTKTASNMGSVIFGYYACYLLGLTLNSNSLRDWSLASLSTEMSSVVTNFQFASSNSIDVNPQFVQGTITDRNDLGYSYSYTGGNQDFPQRNASIAIPMLKPMTLISSASINTNWLNTFRPYVISGLTGDIEPESLAYGLAIAATSGNLSSIIDQFLANCTTQLPFGSTWSSILYWILSSYT